MRKGKQLIVLTRSGLRATLIALQFGLLIGGYPIAAGLSSSLQIPGSALSITARVALIVASLLILIFFRRHHLTQHQHLFWLAFWWFWLTYVSRLFHDTVVQRVPSYFSPEEYFAFAVGACLFPAMAGAVRFHKDSSPLILWKTFFLVLLSMIVVLVGIWTEVSRGAASFIDRGRLDIEKLNPISLGHLGASLTLLAMSVLYTKALLSLKKRGIAVGAFLLGLTLTLLSASRGPILSLFMALLCLWFFGERIRRGRFAKILAAFGAFAFVIGAALLAEESGFQVIHRLQALNDVWRDQSAAGRIESYAGAWNQFLSSPLWGDKIVEVSTGYYPHNVILESLMATGLLGGLPFIVAVAIALRAAMTLIRSGASHGWVGLLCIQYVTGAMFSGALFLNNAMWFFLVASVTAAATYQTRKNFSHHGAREALNYG